MKRGCTVGLSELALMRHVPNTAVIGRPGHYEYDLLTELEAEAWLRDGQRVSRMGDLKAAEFIQGRFGVPCSLSRLPIVMLPGNEALVVRLLHRPPNPSATGHIEPHPDRWEIGLLKRTA
jgi:hypothetical protein